MSEINQNIDLQQINLQEIDRTELDKLIQDFENHKSFEEIADKFNLNKDPSLMSETENKIIQIIYKLGNVDDQIKYLEALVNLKSIKHLSKNNLKDDSLKTMLDNTENQILNKQEQKEKENIEKILLTITQKYNSFSELLQNPQDRLKILEINYPNNLELKIGCPPLIFKTKGTYSLSKAKSEIAQTENQEITNQLEGILPEKDINNILNGGCKAEDLREKLKATNKFNNFEIESLINSVALNKKTLSQIFLRNKLKEKGTSLEEFLNLEDEKEKIKFLTDKGFDKTESKKIIEQYSILEETTKAELETEINMLKYGLEGYNHFSAEYFEKNPDDIKLITNENKLKEILDNSIKKDPEYFKKYYITEIVNPEFSSNLDFVEDFALKLNNNGIKNKLNFFDIKNLKFSKDRKIIISELITIFNIVDENTIKNLLNSLLNSTESYYKLTSDPGYNKILKNSTTKVKEIIEKYSKNYYGFNESSKDLYNTNGNFNGKKDFDPKKFLFLDKGKNIELNKLEEIIYKFLKGEISNKELFALDKFFSKYVKNQPEKFLNTFTNNTNKILLLPKTLNIITNNFALLNKFIKINPKLYSLLPEHRKQDISTKYADSILKSNILTNKEKITLLAEIRFKDIKQKNIIFKKFNKYLKKEEFKLLLKNPSFSLYYAEFLEKNKEKVLESNIKENTNLENNAIKENKKDLEQIEKAYTESNIEESAEKVSKKENNEGIFIKKGKEIGNMIEKYFQDSPELQEKFILIIQNYLNNPSNIRNLFNIEFGKALGIEKYTNFLKDFKKIIDEYLSSPIKTTKKEQTGAEKKYFSKSGEIIIDKFKDEYIYLLALEKQNTEKEEKEFDIEIFTKNFLRKKFPNISEDKLSKIASKIIYEYGGGKEKLKNASNNKELIKAVVHGDTEKINKYLNKIDKETDKKIYKQAKNIKEKQEKENQNAQKTQASEKSPILPDNYNPETGAIVISEDGETDTIKLSPEEQKLVKNNPETLDNIIDFYKTLSRLGLKKLWTVKEQIFKSIENVMGIGFKIDGNYLNENEIKIFLNSILKSIGEEQISPVFTLNNFLTKIETINKTQAMGGTEAIVNTYYGETYLENKFFEKFVGRNNTIVGFNISNFEESLNGKQKQPDFSFGTTINNYIK